MAPICRPLSGGHLRVHKKTSGHSSWRFFVAQARPIFGSKSLLLYKNRKLSARIFNKIKQIVDRLELNCYNAKKEQRSIIVYSMGGDRDGEILELWLIKAELQI